MLYCKQKCTVLSHITYLELQCTYEGSAKLQCDTGIRVDLTEYTLESKANL